ncbi:MAG: nucleotidyl transferase AbiEii/AbiGii toxin family protein [Proteobacteria bacterium]|nr:nucleotidyl transferase AbiEii/AbiGii toxin family protein [Pseudomonadota bacterium]
MSVDPDIVRKAAIAALCRDEWLFEHLVLKGGNALALVYKIGERSSLDLDYSLAGDFRDIAMAGERLQKALNAAFSDMGLHLFDFSFNPKPTHSNVDWWGGYRAEFKLIELERATILGYALDDIRRQAIDIGDSRQSRKFKVEISKYEYVEGANPMPFESGHVRVYPPVLLAAEKLRAILQQHRGYRQIPANMKRSRARDFYDIWCICDHFAIELSAYLDVVQPVFQAKKVELDLLDKIPEIRSLHEASWSDVELSVSRELEAFDFYFQYVCDVGARLHASWMKDPPR